MPSSNFLRYRWTSIWIIAGISIGLIFVVSFSFFEQFNYFLLLLWSSAYLVIGALIGFIFSVPKIVSEPSQQPVALSAENRSRRVEENTNLTQISDWLTKILIGAGLVEIKDSPKFILQIGKVMGQGIRKTPNPLETIDAATTVSVAIILYFITWGFISGYLVMKLVLTDQFAENE
ncbi:hypothetical protein ACO2Q8_28615 [Larkinella sp. VNQ87]|uniref:hypothetical protein n=1 Tax=Larkinella sp. VNQ87 TaxID=3400921 RepID=UPI003C02258F